MKLKAQIPNFLTLSNLICGVLSVYAIFQGAVALGAYLILLAAFFDLLDGLVARALGVSGPLGQQLDSLADMVSFGVAPVFMALHLLGTLSQIPHGFTQIILGFLPVLMAAFSAYRLAVFNLDTRQSDQFIGLPTPAVALFWLSLVLISEQPLAGNGMEAWYAAYLGSVAALGITSLVFAILMVAPIPLIALKFKNYGLRGNVYRYALIALSLLLFTIFAVKAVPIILLLYLCLSLLQNFRNKDHGIQSSN
jgi:CDP-diacylglycerol--serine O-phosphatidyltransferase